MPEANPNMNDEIDLFELIEILWSGKGVIALFVAVGAFVSGIYLAMTPSQYQSKIYYSIALSTHTGAEQQEIVNAKTTNNFEDLFFSEKTLNDWKESHQQSTLSYDLLSATEMIDGFTVQRSLSDRVVVFGGDEDGEYLAVNENDVQLITDVVDYAKFSNAKLTRDLKVNIQHQIADYQSVFNSETSDGGANLENIVQLKYLERMIKNGTNVLKFNAPTRPEKLSPKSSSILLISIMLGWFLGAVFVLIKNAIQKRKAALS